MPEARLSTALRVLRRLAEWSQKDAAEAAEAAGYPKRIDSDAWSKLEREIRQPSFEEAKYLLAPFAIEIRFAVCRDGEYTDITNMLTED